ncbi:hypothetical protein WK25_13020 [Burkholderia latens]|nr:hypothetical protein WK25_13020 [Burkholderia latens]
MLSQPRRATLGERFATHTANRFARRAAPAYRIRARFPTRRWRLRHAAAGRRHVHCASTMRPGCHDVIAVSAGSRGEPVIDRRPD